MSWKVLGIIFAIAVGVWLVAQPLGGPYPILLALAVQIALYNVPSKFRSRLVRFGHKIDRRLRS